MKDCLPNPVDTPVIEEEEKESPHQQWHRLIIEIEASSLLFTPKPGKMATLGRLKRELVKPLSKLSEQEDWA
jgi:hypothetical protein